MECFFFFFKHLIFSTRILKVQLFFPDDAIKIANAQQRRSYLIYRCNERKKGL